VERDPHRGPLVEVAGEQLPIPTERGRADRTRGCQNLGANEAGDLADETATRLACGDVARVEVDDAVVGERKADAEQFVGVLIKVAQGKRATGKPDLRFAAMRDDMHRSQAEHPFERTRHLLCRAPVSRQDDRLHLAAQPGDELLQVGNAGIDKGDFFFLGAHGSVSVVRLLPRGRTLSAPLAGRMVKK